VLLWARKVDWDHFWRVCY